MSKKYYWLKLKDDFFNKKEIKRLRKMAGGDTYTIIYLKMLLLSLKEDGNLFFDGIGDSFGDELALELDEDLDDVKMTLAYLESKGLLEINSEKEYHLNELPHLVGSESESAQRMRRHRLNKVVEIEAPSHCDAIVTNSDIEIEKELELETEKEKENIPYVEIVDYLNSASKKSFKSGTKASQTFIKARWKEGHRLDDFKKVIDTKCSEWMNTEQEQYLRPQTLFGTKFESYLNQKPKLSNGHYKPFESKEWEKNGTDTGRTAKEYADGINF